MSRISDMDLMEEIEMARISAHGTEIGTVYFTTSAKRYMSDGVVLKNSGFGWKIATRLENGVTPTDAYAKQMQRQREELARRPATLAYRKELHELAGLATRWKLHAAIEMMPDDPDGVWSEACDGYGDNVHADIDEIAQLCRLYQAAVREHREMKTAMQPLLA
jgi:hypothetical protein